MSLKKAAPTPSFEESELPEGGDENTGTEAVTGTLSADDRVAAALAAKAGAGKPAKAAEKPAEPAEAATASTSTSTSTSTAVAAPSTSGLAVKMQEADPFTKLENAIRVDYNTLDRIMVNNGNVINKETKGLMGDSCVLELISIQSHWVMSPGGKSDDEESLKFLKYSDDGKTVRETGEPLTMYRDLAVAAGYPEARIVERLILVGMLVDAGKLQSTMEGALVQLDLAPRSMANFKKHRIGTAYGIGKGIQVAENAERVKITCDIQNKGNNTWTDALFSRPK